MSGVWSLRSVISDRLEPLRQRFKRPEPPRLMIEIGEGQAKGLVMELTKGGWSLRKVQVAALGAEAATLAPDWLSALEVNPAQMKIWMILPRQAVSAQILELPSTDPAEISQMLSLQLGKLTPYAPTEVMSPHIVLEASPEGYARVLLLVVKRDAIAQAVNLVSGSGLDVVHVMVSSEGIAQWVSREPEIASSLAQGERVAVLDLDATLSEFLILSQGRWEFTRAIPIGLNRLSEEPEKWADKLVEETRFSLGLYQSEAGGKGREPTRLVLVGQKPSVDLLVDRLKTIDIPVLSKDPLAGLEVSASSPAISLSSLTALLGAGGMTGLPLVNLLPPELVLRQTLQERGKDIAVMGVLLVALLTLMSLVFIEKMVVGMRHLSDLTQAVAELTPEATEVEKAKMRIRFAQERTGSDASALRLLDRLYRVVPEDVTLTAVRLEASKELGIKGYSTSMARIFEFVTALEHLPVFGVVKTRSVTKRKFGNQELADFDLLCELASPSNPKSLEVKAQAGKFSAGERAKAPGVSTRLEQGKAP